MNVSEGFQLRTAYKKKVKPSKLDGLLERRVKQFTLEEKQRLERLRLAALQPKTAPAAAAKLPAVKTEGLKRPEPAVTPGVKAEEESVQVRDHVVKKLDFDLEHANTTSSADAKTQGIHGNSEDVHKELNGEPEPNRHKNSEDAPVEEVSKKRSFEEIKQSSRNSDTESSEGPQSKSSPSQVNGETPPEDPDISSDSASRVQEDVKEPPREHLKSLMNGNLSQKDLSNMAHPPPLKVPKLENHVGDEPQNQEGPEPTKLEPPASLGSKHPENCTGSETLKTSIPNATPQEPKNPPLHDTPDVTSSKPPPPNNQHSSVVTSSLKKRFGDAKGSSSAVAPAVSMTISKEYSTRDRVTLLKFSKTKKARSGTALPSYRKFVTKSSKKSIFVLPNDDLKRLARKAGFREVPIFNYNAKPATDIWPYPSPRPTFGISWRSVTHSSLCF